MFIPFQHDLEMYNLVSICRFLTHTFLLIPSLFHYGQSIYCIISIGFNLVVCLEPNIGSILWHSICTSKEYIFESPRVTYSIKYQLGNVGWYSYTWFLIHCYFFLLVLSVNNNNKNAEMSQCGYIYSILLVFVLCSLKLFLSCIHT